VRFFLVPKAVEEQFQALELDHLFVGNIGDVHRGKIGIPRTGAEAGKLRIGDINGIIPVRKRVVPYLKVRFLYCLFAVLHDC